MNYVRMFMRLYVFIFICAFSYVHSIARACAGRSTGKRDRCFGVIGVLGGLVPDCGSL